MGAAATVIPMVGGIVNAAGILAEDDAAQIEAIGNQKLAMQAAADSIARGQQEALRERMAATQLIARGKVGFASGGVDATVGTPAAALAGSRMMSELDAKTIQNNAFREALGFKTKAEQIKKQAKASRNASTNRAVGSVLGGAGASFSSASDAMSQRGAVGEGVYR